MARNPGCHMENSWRTLSKYLAKQETEVTGSVRSWEINEAMK